MKKYVYNKNTNEYLYTTYYRKGVGYYDEIEKTEYFLELKIRLDYEKYSLLEELINMNIDKFNKNYSKMITTVQIEPLLFKRYEKYGATLPYELQGYVEIFFIVEDNVKKLKFYYIFNNIPENFPRSLSIYCDLKHGNKINEAFIIEKIANSLKNRTLIENNIKFTIKFLKTEDMCKSCFQIVDLLKLKNGLCSNCFYE